MVFGLQKLQNDVFCLTEERDYFQAKFLEQVSEIASLKEELRKAKKEISRLREEVMGGSRLSIQIETEGESSLPLSTPRTPKSNKRREDDDNSTLTSSDQEEEEHNEDTLDDDEKDIRQSAEKLLQWASYRSSVATARTVGSTPENSSLASPSSEPRDSLLDNVPRTIQSESFVDDDEDEDETSSVDSEATPQEAQLLEKFEAAAITSS